MGKDRVVLVGGEKATKLLSEFNLAGETLLADGKIFVGSAAGKAAGVTPSGDVTINNTGVTAIGAGKVTASQVEGLADGEILVGVDGDAANNAKVTVTGDVTMTNAGVTAIGAEKVTLSMLSDNVPKIITGSGGKTMDQDENVAGLSSALTLGNEARGDIISHFANTSRHPAGAHDTTGIADEATDLASLLTLTESLLTLYAAHNTDANLGSDWVYHNGQLNAALSSEVAPTDLDEAIDRLNDLKTKYNTHEASETPHDGGTVTGDEVEASNAEFGTTNRVPVTGVKTGDIASWSILNSGSGTVTGVSATPGEGYVDFAFSDNPQDDAIISYMVMRPAV